jgi:hypothetical protein
MPQNALILAAGLLIAFSGAASARVGSIGPDYYRLNYLRSACNEGDRQSCLLLIRSLKSIALRQQRC